MAKTFINGTGCVSAQNTFGEDFLENAVATTNSNVLKVMPPVYKDYISPAMIRRMAKGVKNGIVASAIAIKESGAENLDAIITGTGLGCIEDSESFLEGILDNNEQHLTPTAFIQSTHNTVGAQIALGMQCKAYNFTYVNGAVSFESALLDAKLGVDAGDFQNVLVGGVDETADYTMKLFKLAGLIKPDGLESYEVLGSTTTGVTYGEGSVFFALADKKQESTYAEIVDVELFNKLSVIEAEEKLRNFLQSNSVEISDLDAVILGFNGDVSTDIYYKNLIDSVFASTPQVYYKHLIGEFYTASAFGLWLGAKILKNQRIPDVVKVNSQSRQAYKNVLLYNQYKGADHSFILLKHVEA